MIAEIIINITAKRLQQTFSYLIPESLPVSVGARVLVPFGHRTEEGIVVAIHDDDQQENDYVMKPIIKILSATNGFQEEMIQTALWISNYYLCSMSESLRLFMIDKKGISTKKIIHLGQRPIYRENQFYPLYDYVKQKGAVDYRSLIKQYPRESVDALISADYLIVDTQLVNNIADKMENWLVYKKDDLLDTLKNKHRQKELLAELKQCHEAPLSDFIKKGYSRPVIQGLLHEGFAIITPHIKQTVDLMGSLSSDTPYDLTQAQQKAFQRISQDTSGETYVLHGVTGSGKTEIYMRLTEKLIRQDKQVILLVPEIALTGQIVRTFIRRFGNDVVVQHSQLSKGERRNNWLRMLHKESHICIGARSAVFTAVQDLGLVIIDEAHDGSYKQDEAPRYHAVAVARKRAAYYHCPVILGSATPSLEAYYKAKKGDYVLLELPERVQGRPMPAVKIVDMREELEKRNYRVISDDLADLLRNTLANKQQAIILLNRRGFSTFVMCRKCGYVVKCETCDVAMVYHKDKNTLKCHYCENEKPVPTVCPSCGSKFIKFFGTGTQKVEEQLHELFPTARIIRLDQDSTTRKNSGDRIIEDFRHHRYDILLGTQMVAKGHDFPDVSAVGILSADSLLNLPVYWAGERTFQLLTQAAGRAGRGDIPGNVVMQTYAPEHYVIQCSKEQDFKSFYAKEIEYRRELSYPPFHQLIKIIISHEDEQETWRLGNQLIDLLHQWQQQDSRNDTVEVVGPYVDTIKMIRNKYRIIILIKGPDLLEIKKYIKNHADFYKTGIIIDVDPTF